MGNEDFMKEAIAIAIENVKKGGGPFGAIVVKDGRIISKGSNEVTRTNDPTAHAEVIAIRKACRELNDFNLSGCTIFSSCEPCPMCLAAIYWARIDKVYFGAARQDAASYGFDDLRIAEEMGIEMHKRSLPMVQLLPVESLKAFTEWQNFEARRWY